MDSGWLHEDTEGTNASPCPWLPCRPGSLARPLAGHIAHRPRVMATQPRV